MVTNIVILLLYTFKTPLLEPARHAEEFVKYCKILGFCLFFGVDISVDNFLGDIVVLPVTVP